MARPETKGLKYFPFDVGFFEDRGIRRLRGQHGPDGVDVYIRILCQCYKDNGYFLVWDDGEDFALLADDTGFPEAKLRGIMETLLSRSLLCKLAMRGNPTKPATSQSTLAVTGNGNNLSPPVTVLTSRGIQRRYFDAIKDTRARAAAQDGRHTTIPEDICLLTEDDFLKINERTVWLKVAKTDHYSGINPSKSGINPSKSGINPTKERKVKESKVKKSKGKESNTPREGAEALPPGFAGFWAAYPKKANRPDAIKAWKQVRGDKNEEEILRSVESFKATQGWTKDNGQFIPHPASWLRGKRWEDETGESESASDILRRMYEGAEREQGENEND